MQHNFTQTYKLTCSIESKPSIRKLLGTTANLKKTNGKLNKNYGHCGKRLIKGLARQPRVNKTISHSRRLL